MYVALIGYSDAAYAEQVRAFIADLPSGTIPHMKTMHRDRPFEISSYEHSGLGVPTITDLTASVIPRAVACGLGTLFNDPETSVTGIAFDIVTRESALARAVPVPVKRVKVVGPDGKPTSRSKLSAAEKEARYQAHLTLWGCYECTKCNTRGLGSLEAHNATCTPRGNLADVARARLETVLDTARGAVLASPPGTARVNFIDPKTTFAGAPGYGRAERAAAGTFTLSPAMIADIKAQPERRNVNRVLEHLRGLEKYPEVEWIQTSAVAALLKQLSNQESREAAGGVSDLVRASKGPGGLADVVRALGKWYVKDMKAALTDVFKLSDAGNRADLTNRIAAAVVSGGEAAVLAAEASAAVAVPANAAAVSAAVASNNDVPMGTSGDAMEGGAPPPLLQAAAAAAAVASGGACRAAQNSYALRTFAHRCWFFCHR